MPTVEVNGTTLYYEDTGGEGPPVLFSHGLLMSAKMWAPQVDALRDTHRCITYDHRGQGRSAVPRGSTVAMDEVAADAIALIGALGLGRVRFVGLSMGGFAGMRVAARRPELIEKLALLETAADAEPAENCRKYRNLNRVARLGGLRFLGGQVAPIMFGRTFLEDPARAQEARRWRDELLGNRRQIYKAVNGVIERPAFTELANIRAPTVVLWSAEDRAITRSRARALCEGIEGAQWVELPRGGHSISVEEPERVNASLREFFA